MKSAGLPRRVAPDGTTGETTSHLTRLSKNDSQVIGYSQSTDETTDRTTSHLTSPAKDAGQVIGYSHPTKQPAEELLAGHPKDGCQVVGYKPASGQVAGYRKDATPSRHCEAPSAGSGQAKGRGDPEGFVRLCRVY